MAKYLYGANVKAVQAFIFQTSKLTEIIGASELVEQICTTRFENQVKNFKNENCIIAASGIVKYIFDSEKECQDLVRVFPKVVLNTTPGIVFNQAVVKIADDKPTKEELKELERRLKTQRNKAIPPLETGLRITERSRRTGLPVVDFKKKLDKATLLKHKANTSGVESLGKKLSDDKIIFEFPTYIEEIASENNYIAIIHADGNNLGKAIRDINENFEVNNENRNKENNDSIELNKNFSLAINEATVKAARCALEKTFRDLIGKAEVKNGIKTVKLPLRPVILGGDDFTVICNAENALELTTNYLNEFEKKSKEAFEENGLKLPKLTACAGIAYIKYNYPFHFGVKLAEDLCAYSKKISKEQNPSSVPASLTFHRVQSSFVGEYSDIIKEELQASATGLMLGGGPYYISYGENTVKNLMDQVICLNDKDIPNSKLRKWISTCHINKSLAIEDLERIIKILTDNGKETIIKGLGLKGLLDEISGESEKVQTNLYDAITIHSLNSQYDSISNLFEPQN